MATSTLPEEIWRLICELFCVHCGCKQMPDFSFPKQDHDFKDSGHQKNNSQYQQGKSNLVALSLTSRDLRKISQPVLHHCFYDYPDQNRTSKFLRTLIYRPRLADSVRILALPKWTPHEIEFNARSEIEVWKQMGSQLNIPSPRWIDRLLVDEGTIFLPQGMVAFGPVPDDGSETRLITFDRADPDSRVLFHHRSRVAREFLRDLRLWQHYLLVGLCSKRLTHLAVSGIWGPVQQPTNPRALRGLLGPSHPLQRPFEFSNLRIFSCEDTSFQDEFPAFFSMAPRLRHVAAGSIQWLRHASSKLTTPTPLNNVRSLSFSCYPQGFADIIRLFNQVQDLEFHLEVPCMYSASNMPGPALDPWPASIKQQIRRLCWSASFLFGHGSMLANEGKKLLPPLQEFQNLEILEIDRDLLEIAMRTALGRDPFDFEGNSPELPEFLPPSIRILHFSFGEFCEWFLSDLVLELEELAAAKTTCLPLLSIIQIDESARHADDKTLAEAMQGLGVVRAMRDAGIELRFGLDLSNERSSQRQGMRSPLPGNLYGPYRHKSPDFPYERHQNPHPPFENFLLED